MAVEEPPPDRLPDGWVMEVRRLSTGRTYKCSTAPLTGRKFYSRTDVSRYLEIGKVRNRSKRRRKDIDTPSPTNMRRMHTNAPDPTNVTISVNYFEEGLPPGWIKGVKVKEAGSRIIRRDAEIDGRLIKEILQMSGSQRVSTVVCSVGRLQQIHGKFYIDPVTGLEFRSKIEVSNYLKTGEVPRRVRKPNKRLIADVETTCRKICLPVEAKRTELAGSRTRRFLLTGECSKGGVIIKDEQVQESSLKERKISMDPYDLCATGCTTSEASAMNCLEGSVSREIKSNRSSTEGRMVSASSLALILMAKQPLMIDTTKQKNDNPQSDSHNKDKEGLNIARRTSKRLADLRAKQALGQFNNGEDLPIDMKLAKYEKPLGNLEAEEEQSKDHEIDGEYVEDDSERESPVTMIEEQTWNFEAVNGDMKPHHSITSIGERIQKLETDENLKPSSAAVLPEEFTENVDTNYESILEPALAITLPEECCGSLATVKEIDEKETISSCPFGESWPDPCLEFAFKTLAGEISVEADFVTRNYFERLSDGVPYQNSNGSESSDPCVDKFLQTDDALLQLGLLDRPASSTQLQTLTSTNEEHVANVKER